MPKTIDIISPIDNSLVAQRTLASPDQITHAVAAAVNAQHLWQKIPIQERAAFCHSAIDAMVANSQDIAREITLQIGRPIQYAEGEIRGLEERARHMIDIAANTLADMPIVSKQGFTRFIRHEPLGLAFTIAPWNYPYLTAVNSIIPALMAGNAVILKHSKQTLLCAERFQQVFDESGLPASVFQHLHLDHVATTKLIKDKATNFISFTGSVQGGAKIEQSVAGLFKNLALELGGKDPAYVCADANIEDTVTNLVDGAFFNAGQSCCGIERIYVQKDVYENFLTAFVERVKQYRLGNPLEPETTLGPMINIQAANFVRQQIKQACDSGATACIDQTLFPADKINTPYLAPQVLTNVNHSMSVMMAETFGPVVGIMKTKHDQEAIQLMNDSPYGLTASIWTQDEKQAITLGEQVHTGTVFMNRCDYLDPALAWVGVKQSGRGCALSSLGYEQLTRPKSFHLRK